MSCLFFYFTSSPELSIDELRCHFFGVVLGDGVAAIAGGDGLIGGESNGSRVGVGPFFLGIKMDINGGGMDLLGGVDGDLMIRGCLRSWSSRFLKSRSSSNFSRPGLKDLTLGGVGCLGGVLGGYLSLGEDVFWACFFLEESYRCWILLVRGVDCWCPPGSTFGSEVGASTHLFPQSATRPLTIRY